MKSPLITCLAAAALAPLCSCSSVQPWERGTLAKPVMDPARTAHSVSISEHMWFTREAFAGGRSVGGGGCGCN